MYVKVYKRTYRKRRNILFHYYFILQILFVIFQNMYKINISPSIIIKRRSSDHFCEEYLRGYEFMKWNMDYTHAFSFFLNVSNKKCLRGYISGH